MFIVQHIDVYLLCRDYAIDSGLGCICIYESFRRLAITAEGRAARPGEFADRASALRQTG